MGSARGAGSCQVRNLHQGGFAWRDWLGGGRSESDPPGIRMAKSLSVPFYLSCLLMKRNAAAAGPFACGLDLWQNHIYFLGLLTTNERLGSV